MCFGGDKTAPVTGTAVRDDVLVRFGELLEELPCELILLLEATVRNPDRPWDVIFVPFSLFADTDEDDVFATLPQLVSIVAGDDFAHRLVGQFKLGDGSLDLRHALRAGRLIAARCSHEHHEWQPENENPFHDDFPLPFLLFHTRVYAAIRSRYILENP